MISLASSGRFLVDCWLDPESMSCWWLNVRLAGRTSSKSGNCLGPKNKYNCIHAKVRLLHCHADGCWSQLLLAWITAISGFGSINKCWDLVAPSSDWALVGSRETLLSLENGASEASWLSRERRVERLSKEAEFLCANMTFRIASHLPLPFKRASIYRGRI